MNSTSLRGGPQRVAAPESEADDRPPPIPRCRRCGAAHRSWRKLAECRLKALWVSGSNRYASVAYCPRGVTVCLFETIEEAREARAQIDKTGCGGACIKQHIVCDLAVLGGRAER